MGTDTSTALAELSAAGVSIWLDDISRDRLNTGNLADLVGRASAGPDLLQTHSADDSRGPVHRPLAMPFHVALLHVAPM